MDRTVECSVHVHPGLFERERHHQTLHALYSGDIHDFNWACVYLRGVEVTLGYSLESPVQPLGGAGHQGERLRLLPVPQRGEQAGWQRQQRHQGGLFLGFGRHTRELHGATDGVRGQIVPRGLDE